MYVKTRLKRLTDFLSERICRKCGKTRRFPSVQSHTATNQTGMGVKPYIRPRLKGQVVFSYPRGFVEKNGITRRIFHYTV